MTCTLRGDILFYREDSPDRVVLSNDIIPAGTKIEVGWTTWKFDMYGEKLNAIPVIFDGHEIFVLSEDLYLFALRDSSIRILN